MTANKVYYPGYIGGRILGVQMIIQNASLSDVTALSTNGVYYTFEGRDYQLLSLDGVEIPAGETKILNEEFREYLTPNADIKIMVDTGGLVDCVIDVQILWGV